MKPIRDGDRLRCHGTTRRAAGVDLSSYAGVMRVVTPGSASSLLVRVTTSGGLMYNELSGSRATKSATIRSWVVDNQAAQTR